MKDRNGQLKQSALNGQSFSTRVPLAKTLPLSQSITSTSTNQCLFCQSTAPSSSSSPFLSSISSGTKNIENQKLSCILAAVQDMVCECCICWVCRDPVDIIVTFCLALDFHDQQNKPSDHRCVRINVKIKSMFKLEEKKKKILKRLTKFFYETGPGYCSVILSEGLVILDLIT